MLNKRLIIVLKSRQVGWSTLLCAYALWKCKFNENTKILMLSQGEEEAFDLVSKCRFMEQNMPDWMQSIRNPDQSGLIGFQETKSEIRALPSTEKAGHGTDATVVICDEWEYHPYAELNFAAIKPSIDAGGQFIGLSTADKTKINTFFKQKYHEALAGTSNFVRIFVPWHARPGRTKEWFTEIAKDYKDWQLEQEYPDNEQEALGILKARKYFDQQALDEMPVRIPVHCEIADKYKGIVRVYQLPIPGERYSIFTDPSDGKEDPHALVVRRYKTGEWVAVSHGMIPAGECAEIHDALVRFYNDAWNSYELNSRAGGIFSEKISQLDTPRQCPFLDTNGQLNTSGKRGWWTSKSLKGRMLLNLEEHVRLRVDTIYDKEAIDELKVFFIPEGEEPQAPQGAHDDFVIAGGGVIMIDKYMPSMKPVVQSFKLNEAW